MDFLDCLKDIVFVLLDQNKVVEVKQYLDLFKYIVEIEGMSSIDVDFLVC